MSRTRWGTHGKVSKRANGNMMLTYRPPCWIFNDRDLAMILGRRIEVIVPVNRWDDNPPKTYKESADQISDWESRNGRLTQAHALTLIGDLHYLACWEMGDGTHENFNPEKESHRAMLDKVRQILARLQ